MRGLARSWLFVPGHRADMLAKAPHLNADVIVIDLEDGVPPDHRNVARSNAAQTLALHPAWVRINRTGTNEAAADLDAVGALATGIRLSKVESAEDVEWVHRRVQQAQLGCTIESARGVASASEILASSGVNHASFGAADLAADLAVAPDSPSVEHARAQVLLAAHAVGVKTVIDGAYTRLDDDEGLRAAALHARAMGFSGKSAIHPRQVQILNDVFSPSLAEIAWARQVVAAFASSSSNPTRVPETGELADPPVVARAQTILEAVHD